VAIAESNSNRYAPWSRAWMLRILVLGELSSVSSRLLASRLERHSLRVPWSLWAAWRDLSLGVDPLLRSTSTRTAQKLRSH